MLFHIGALWRLNEEGLLTQASRISSVSGGSITAGWLALCWARGSWGKGNIPANQFWEDFATGLRRLASRRLDVPSILRGFLPGHNVGREVAALYDEVLFKGATLQDLPDTPRFVFNASNLQSGALWRFSKPYMGDHRVGLINNPTIGLSLAVAASSAFPPVLSPVELRLTPAQYTARGGENLNREPFTTAPLLTDGGVYDNLGLEPVFKEYRTVFVSDGGSPFREQEAPSRAWPFQLKRVLDCIDNQVRSLRKRQLIESFNSGLREGTYWGIGTGLDRYPVDCGLKCSAENSHKLARIPTRLTPMEQRIQDQLINWGYAACAASLASHFSRNTVAATWPYPTAGLE
jgi:NTE family protein